MFKLYIVVEDDGIYTSRYVETVPDRVNAVDRVAELQAETGYSAFYEEVDEDD